IRRGLPPAVMYRKPAQARNSADVARPTWVATLSRPQNNSVIATVFIDVPPRVDVLAAQSCASWPSAADEVLTPKTAEDALNRNHLARGRGVDLLSAAD